MSWVALPIDDLRRSHIDILAIAAQHALMGTRMTCDGRDCFVLPEEVASNIAQIGGARRTPVAEMPGVELLTASHWALTPEYGGVAPRPAAIPAPAPALDEIFETDDGRHTQRYAATTRETPRPVAPAPVPPPTRVDDTHVTRHRSGQTPRPQAPAEAAAQRTFADIVHEIVDGQRVVALTHNGITIVGSGEAANLDNRAGQSPVLVVIDPDEDTCRAHQHSIAHIHTERATCIAMVHQLSTIRQYYNGDLRSNITGVLHYIAGTNQYITQLAPVSDRTQRAYTDYERILSELCRVIRGHRHQPEVPRATTAPEHAQTAPQAAQERHPGGGFQPYTGRSGGDPTEVRQAEELLANHRQEIARLEARLTELRGTPTVPDTLAEAFRQHALITEVAVGDNERTVRALTAPITHRLGDYEYNFGVYRITTNTTSRCIGSEIPIMLERLAGVEQTHGYLHPHSSVNSSGLCLGNAGDMLRNAWRNREWSVLVDVLLSFLQHVNYDDSYAQRIKFFPRRLAGHTQFTNATPNGWPVTEDIQRAAAEQRRREVGR